jgi:predicted DsbA family dithiol-disulfide isomerase
VEKLLQEDPTIKVIYKPVSLFTDPLIIRASLAAHKQGKYKEIHNALMSQTINPTKDTVKNLAKKLGLDMPRFLEDLESEEIRKHAAENESFYKQLGLAGTPTYIIEKTAVIPGHIELDEFKSLLKSIKEEQAKGAAEESKKAA